MTEAECFEKDITFDKTQHLLADKEMNPEILKTVIDNIIRKAQMENDYNIFYGQLCEDLMRLELNLKGLEPKMNNMKNSEFREALFDSCKDTFEKFFQSDEKKEMN